MEGIGAALAASLLAIGGTVGADASHAASADGREWELVSSRTLGSVPPVGVLAVDASGDRIAYLTGGPLPGAPAGSLVAPSLAVRGPSGWSSTPVGHPYSIAEPTLLAAVPTAASADLATWIWNSSVPLLPGAPGQPDSGWYRDAVPGGPLALLGSGGEAPVLAGVSADAERVVFQTSTPLLPADAGRLAGGQVYEYASSTLRLVGVDDSGEPLSDCGVLAGSASGAPNAVSRDARRVFLTSPEIACEGAVTRVYLREDGERTIDISASRCTRADCGAPADVRFMGATPSGSVAFLATVQQLTDDDSDASPDLYRYEVADGTLSRVSAAPGAGAAEAIATRAYPAADGSRVYFLASGALVPGEGVEGSPNLYVADAEGLRFVATLDPADGWPSGAAAADDLADVLLTPGAARRIMFPTIAQLRPDDTDLAHDLYLYDAVDGSLARVSGVAASGNSDHPASSLATGFLGRAPFPLNAARALSDDGRHVFFSTREPLVSSDLDGAVDVYEWFDGGIGLVSPGADGYDARFYGASPSGDTVFFSTAASLVGWDDDAGDYDLYAARSGGGFPGPAPDPPPGECGEACRGPAPARLERSEPASAKRRARGPRRIGVRAPGPAALRRMAARGRLSLVVAAPLAGRVSAVATIRLGGRSRVVGRGHAHVRRTTRHRLVLRLRPPARRWLADGRDLVVTLRHSRPGRVGDSTIRLRSRRAR